MYDILKNIIRPRNIFMIIQQHDENNVTYMLKTIFNAGKKY